MYFLVLPRMCQKSTSVTCAGTERMIVSGKVNANRKTCFPVITVHPRKGTKESESGRARGSFAEKEGA